MENKKGSSFVFVVIALILGTALSKQFDFDTFKFEKPALATLYIIVLAASIYFIVRNYRATRKK